MGLPAVLEALGVSPRLAFEQAGVDPRVFEHSENHIGYTAIGRLLSVCSTLSQRGDIGLLATCRFGLRDFGILGDLMRHSATVGDALQALMMYLKFHDQLAFPLLVRTEAASVFLGYSIDHSEVEGTAQIYDAAITVAFKLLRELCGPDWQPRLVQISHHKPNNLVPYRRMFGPRILFNAEWSGVSFAASWLDKELPDSDPIRYRKLERELLTLLSTDSHSFATEVRHVLRRLLLGGESSSAAVAQMFAISDRTLRHKLRAEGTCMQQLLADTRFELARHLLQGTRLPVAKIAASLCYSDTATFSRAFHSWADVSPRKWRASQAAPNLL